MSEQAKSFSIKNWSEDDRPREKLLRKGRSALSDAELVAILIGSGSIDESAVSLSKRILSAAGNNLNELGKFSLKQLMAFKGIGEAKAVSIAAALELGRRRRGAQALDRKKITGSISVFELMQPQIGELPHEEFWVLYLNNSNRVIEQFPLSKGGITGTVADVRLAMKKALETRATGIVLAHNHPSGTLKPSRADRDLTAKFKSAAQSLDITLHDHVIITEVGYYSFADEGVI